MNPEFNSTIKRLKKIKSSVKDIKKEIISQTRLINNDDFILSKEKEKLSNIEVLLKKAKRKNTEKINPTFKNYNVYQLLEIYPYYYLKKSQKDIIEKNIQKIIKEDEEKILFNLFLYLFFEEKNKELNIVFKSLAQKKHLKTLKIMESYFLFSNHVVNYNKVKKLINNIENIE